MTTYQRLGTLHADDPETVGGYTIVGRVGSGGFKTVYLGISESGTRAAIGILHEELAQDPSYRRGFDLEIDAILLVRGPFVARVTGHELEANRPWMASEFVNGHSLAAARSSGSFDEPMLIPMAAAWASALSEIHSAGVIHRDFKPGNVILHRHGAKVIDFGIAHLPREETAATLAKVGNRLGTPGYMSPEQAVGDEITVASDVFSWGSTVCFAAAGETPFGSGASEAVLYRVVHEVPDIPELPTELNDLVRGALEKNPSDRPTTDEIMAGLALQAGLELSLSAIVSAETLAQNWNLPASLFETRHQLPEPRTLQPMAASRSELDSTEIGGIEPLPHTSSRVQAGEGHSPNRRLMQRSGFVVAAIALLLLGTYLGSNWSDSGEEVKPSAPTTNIQPTSASTSPTSPRGEADIENPGTESTPIVPSDKTGDEALANTAGDPTNSIDCSDFATYEEANAWFNTYRNEIDDIAKLDPDGNGQPCESLQRGPTTSTPTSSVPPAAPSTSTSSAPPAWPNRENCSPHDGGLKIGLLLPETGDAARWSVGPRIAAEAAIRAINSWGVINGDAVTLVSAHEGESLGDTRDSIEYLLCEEQVSAIVGPFYSWTKEYLPAITADWPVVLCMPFSNHLDTMEVNSELIFSTIASDSALTRTLASLVWSEGGTRVALLTYGHRKMDLNLDLENSFVSVFEDLGGSIVYNGEISYNVLNRVVSMEADSVVIASFESDFSEFALQRLEEVGVSTSTHSIYIIGAGPPDISESEYEYDDLTSFQYAQYIDSDNGGSYELLVRSIIEKVDEDASWFHAAHTMDCTSLIAIAAHAAQSNRPEIFSQFIVSSSSNGETCIIVGECAGFLDAGTNIDFDGLSGPVDLATDGTLAAGYVEIFELGAEGFVESSIYRELVG